MIFFFRIGNRQLVAGCRFRLWFLNRQLNRQLESESVTRAKIGNVSVGWGWVWLAWGKAG